MNLIKVWNWLAIEYEENQNAKIVHYTLGTPCFDEIDDMLCLNIGKSILKNFFGKLKIKYEKNEVEFRC